MPQLMEEEKPEVGVYVCHCGLNIASVVDVYGLTKFAARLPYVNVARQYKFMCSEPGQNLIKDDITAGKINRVVVASCSPLMHESTFRAVAEHSGLNPFLVQMANIREQVCWVTKSRQKATKKAKSLIGAAVLRVINHNPIEKKEVNVHQAVAIIGGGVAGLSASLLLADGGKNVHLIEKEPTIGGHMGYFDKTFPTLDCAACTLTPIMVKAGSHPRINLITNAEVESVEGSTGNFKIRIIKKPRYIDENLCNGCGQCINNCPATAIPSKRTIKLGNLQVSIKNGSYENKH